MACLKAPLIPIPSIPLLSLPAFPSLPTISIGLQLCCTIQINAPTPQEIAYFLGITIPAPPIFSIPGSTALIVAITKAIGSLNAILDKLEIPCPLDGVLLLLGASVLFAAKLA